MIQRTYKRLAMLYNISIQIPCLPPNESLTLKMEKLSTYPCQIVTRAFHTFITYLFAAPPGEWRHTTDALRQSPPWRRGHQLNPENLLLIQLKRLVTISYDWLHLVTWSAGRAGVRLFPQPRTPDHVCDHGITPRLWRLSRGRSSSWCSGWVSLWNVAMSRVCRELFRLQSDWTNCFIFRFKLLLSNFFCKFILVFLNYLLQFPVD